MTNQAQIISAPPPREFERLKTAPGITTGSKVAVGGMWFMQTNTKRAPFDDVNFRKAVSCAIDRKKIAEGCLLWPDGPDAPCRRRPTVLVSQCRGRQGDRLRSRAGRRTIWRSRNTPSNAEFELLVPSTPYLFDATDAAVVMQSQLAAIGIKMRITAMEMPQILQRDIAGTQVASLLPLMGPSDPTFIIQICYTADQLMSKSSGLDQPGARRDDQGELQVSGRRAARSDLQEDPGDPRGGLPEHLAWLRRRVECVAAEIKNFKPNTGLTIWTRDIQFG